MNRRQFLQCIGAAGVSCAVCPNGDAESAPVSEDSYGMLVDTTECIGCRKCEWACAQANQLTGLPLEDYESEQVFDQPRRMTADAFTVVNRYPDPEKPKRPTHVKVQCMHCLKPACVSACLVGALQKNPNGAVTYDAWKCLGCRYCMVACPFQVPAYEYEDAFTPRIRKCTFCFERLEKEGKTPACAEICPPMCLTFAKRSELITLAHEKIQANPDRYLDHVYGEHELGGTGWMYLTNRPVTELGMLEFGEKPIPAYTETLQHSLFKMGLPPALLFGVLAAAMKTFGEKQEL